MMEARIATGQRIAPALRTRLDSVIDQLQAAGRAGLKIRLTQHDEDELCDAMVKAGSRAELVPFIQNGTYRDLPRSVTDATESYIEDAAGGRIVVTGAGLMSVAGHPDRY